MPFLSQRQIHHLTLGLLVCCALGLAHDRATAATFCVSTAPDLATSLLVAESNGEDDLIQVVQGMYEGRFIYSAAEERRLTVEGGYLAGCASRVVDPANTVLDGVGTGPVLGLASARSADFVVDGFTIQNGSTTGAIGGGLVISSIGGEQRISHNTVLNNTAGGNRGAGIVVLNAATAMLSDNIVSNNSYTGCCDTNGGGMAIFATTVNLTNNTVTNNAHFGCCDGSGGVFIAATLVTLANNTVDGNSLGCCAGGGLGVRATTITLTSNRIRGNTSDCCSTGGGLSLSAADVSLTNNVIEGNTINCCGGGGLSLDATEAMLTNNILQGNMVSGCCDGGGGARIFATLVTLANNTIDGNTLGDGNGGGATIGGVLMTFVNNTVTRNQVTGCCDGNGGGLFIAPSPSLATLTNNTITENSASGQGGGVWLRLTEDNQTADLYNNIIWNNRAPQGADLFVDNDGNGNLLRSPVNLFHNDFDQSPQGIFITLPFLIDPSNLDNEDPLFVDPAAGDYHLQPESPVIDQGTNDAPALPPTDKDGNPRVVHGVVDLGAFEFQEPGDVADLGLTKTDTPDDVPIGGALTYTLIITNDGPKAATAVRVTDPLPADVRFRTVATTQGGCKEATRTVTCDLETLATGASATVTIEVTPTSEGTITNTASVTATETDPNPGNNTDTAETEVTADEDAVAMRPSPWAGSGPRDRK
jgi:uncharacterized repeat protein (TIGR01451 family)